MAIKSAMIQNGGLGMYSIMRLYSNRKEARLAVEYVVEASWGPW